jgi:hypothetical protein
MTTFTVVVDAETGAWGEGQGLRDYTGQAVWRTRFGLINRFVWTGTPGIPGFV